MSNHTNLEQEISGHTAIVTLANSSANTWTSDSLAALIRLTADLYDNPEIRKLVITGRREKLLSDGADLEAAMCIGLVDQGDGAGETKQAALALVGQAAKQSPSSVAACKRLIQGARAGTPADWLPVERELLVDLFDTEHQKEGVNAFLCKRPAQWRNL